MEWLQWIDNLVQETLTERIDAIDHWRSQVLTKSNRVKNFENWILIELVHQLRLGSRLQLKP
jgi:hypothetical protein